MSDWKLFGRIIVDESGKPEFPDKLPEGIVVYKIRLDGGRWIYIGCTEKLKQHLGQYRSGKTGVELERVIHEFIIEAGGGDLFLWTGKKVKSRSEGNVVKKALIAEEKSDEVAIISVAESKRRLAVKDKNSLFSVRDKSAASRKAKSEDRKEATIRVFNSLQKEKGRRPRQDEVIRVLEKEGIIISSSTCTRYLKGIFTKV